MFNKVINDNNIYLTEEFKSLFLEWLKYKSEKRQTYKETDLKCDNITHYHGLPASVDGDKKVASVTFKGEAIPVSGAFFLKDSINPGVLLSGLDMAGGHIIVDRTQKTNIDGVYAAGDCTGRPYQYAKAVGEGNVAVHSVLDYLKKHKDN